MAPQVNPQLVKRVGAFIMIVNIAVAFFSITDMYLLASGAIQVDPPSQSSFETSYDPLAMDFVFKSSYSVENNGFYDLKDLDITSTLTTEKGEVLIKYESTGMVVPRWSKKTFPIEAHLPLEKFLELDLGELLFNSSNFVLKVNIGAGYVMGLVHFDLDQVRDYPWDAPLEKYSHTLGDGSIEGILGELLEGDYSGASEKVATAVFGAFLASGGEARVPLNDYTHLVIVQEEGFLDIMVEIVTPFHMTIAHFEVPIGDVGMENDMPVEGQGGGVGEG